LTRIRTRLAALALAVLVPASLAGCFGGGGSSEDPQQVLDQTFQNDQTVSSGVLDLSVSGSAGDQGNFSASLKGPFQGQPDNPASVPQLDWTGSLTASGAGQSLNGSAGITITQDNLYVTYKDQAYELGTDTFKQLQQAQQQAASQNGSSGQSFSEACQQAVQQAGGDTSVCDIDFTGWLTNLSNEGTTDVGGTSTIHIHGDADIAQILQDVGPLVQQAGGAAGAGFDPSQLGQFSDAVTNATIDVYSGESDHLLRKLDLAFTIDPSKLGAATPVPVGPIEIKFSLSLSDVNQPQTVSAPQNAKPIGDLSKVFGGGLGPLGSLGGSSLGGAGLPSVPGGAAGGGSSSGSAYFSCVQKAAGDPDKINACAQQL
jgi:hypothetical protein